MAAAAAAADAAASDADAAASAVASAASALAAAASSRAAVSSLSEPQPTAKSDITNNAPIRALGRHAFNLVRDSRTSVRSFRPTINLPIVRLEFYHYLYCII